MCACRVEASPSPSPTTPIDLDDYYQYLDMEQQQQQQAAPRSDPGSETEDVYAQLAQKEKDLILAAELGKALLDKNDELQRRNEQLLEEYQAKLEELQQEKYGLRLRVETVEGEYENTVKELQTDIALLRKQYDDQEMSTRMADRERHQMVQELTKQNERLTEELKKTTHEEEELGTEVKRLRDQMKTRRTSMHQHVNQLEVLREEITVLSERKNDLEKRMTHIIEERDSLACNLEESQDRIMMLEKQKREQDQQLRSKERELEELRESNSALEDKLEEMSLHASNHSFSHNNSLFSELEMSHNMEGTDVEMGSRSSGHSSAKLGSHPISPHFQDMEDDIECDDDDYTMQAMASGGGDMQLFSRFQSQHDDEDYQLREEVIQAYRQVRHLLRTVRGSRADGDSSPIDEAFVEFERGSLITLLSDLRCLIEDMMQKQALFQSPSYINDLTSKIDSLQSEVSCAQTQLESVKSTVKVKDTELKRKTDEITELTNKLTLQQHELNHIQKERDDYQDQADDLTRDEIVERARKDRDEAIAKRNAMEVDLAKSKLDLMNLDQQLMDAIQQKIELSQQLEQWELDMQALIEIQMQKRFNVEMEDKTEEPKKFHGMYPESYS
ncbi:BICD family-like cargo adapter 1 isoform X2 [Lineus longissimus]|uniref:BICD family-like cargo adapter 1 isoform X2 n=1 Tax=Lineus longissimus TaxID=88925 RepID=UPI002B4C3129